MNSRHTGTVYERKAERFLLEKGYEILERNFRCYCGEIDLIARQGMSLVFVEVKYRRDRKSGFPEEAVSPLKQQKICRVSDYYRMRKGISERLPFRYDVIAVEGEELRHYENAFDYVGR